MIVNVVEEGTGFPWHFDTNNFAVRLAIQNGEAGDMFKQAPGLRSAENECFHAVADVLDGWSDRVQAINLVPGDLQIFKGRYSLHRVTPVTGPQRRYVEIFPFSKQRAWLAVWKAQGNYVRGYCRSNWSTPAFGVTA